jgi:hypothetical protein
MDNVCYARQIMKRRWILVRTLALAGICAGVAAAQSPQTQSGPPILSITGDVSSPTELKAEDLAKMPRETVSVKEEDGGTVSYEGVPLREVTRAGGCAAGQGIAR